jgi:subfamily B ATP-binding cassette protein MsbA
LLFIPVVITSARKIGHEVRTRTRTGQDKLAEIQNILHETVTGNRIVKAFNTELWEILRFKNAARGCSAPTCAACVFNRSVRR